MKKQETFLTVISYFFLLVVLVLLGFCYQLHMMGNQETFVILISIVFICFGIVLTAETKLKWLEASEKE